MDMVIRDVTLETVNQAIANKAGIKPGEAFSVVVVDNTQPRRRLADIAARMRATAAARGLPPEDNDQPAASPTPDVKGRMERLLAKAGAGVALVGEQSTDSIDQRIREFRGDE